MYKIKQLPEDFIVEEVSSLELKGTGEYSYYLLEKKDIDTEKAILKIADYFRMQRRFFGIAGNKDRHAITRQYFSVKGEIRDHDFVDFSIKRKGYGDRPISVGDLAANKFTIVVRGIDKKPKPIAHIINYFDEQRFGKHNIEIGMAILKKDFRKAAGLIDYPDSKRHLEKNKTDYVNSIRKTPFRIITMYIHALQSYLWNEAAADYIKVKSKKYSELKYQQGVFIFPEEKIKNIGLPLLSFDTEFESKEIEKIYTRILEKNSLSLRDFIIRQLPDITPVGGKRSLITEVNNLKVSELEKDELNEGNKKITLSFELGKGSYATIVVRQMFG